MAHDVFISDSNKGKPVADAVRAGLEARGLPQRVTAAPPGPDRSIEINVPHGLKFKIPR